jgi:Bacterial membrane protein YfhO
MIFTRSGEPGANNVQESPWFRPGRFGLLLALLFMVSFPQVISGLQAFCYYDAGQFGFPVAFFNRETWWHGEVPLWNPYNSCGIPFLAQWNTMALYPLSAFYLIFPLPWSYDVFCLGHLFLAGLGMYFLARRWTGNPLAAAVAGVVFAFNGLSWYSLMWGNIVASLGWMPWVVLAVERGWREGGKWLALAALATGMQLLSGGAEVIIMTWLLLVVLWLAQIGQGQIPRVKMTVRAILIGALGTGIAAAQLLPFLDLLQSSQRGAGFGRSDFAAIPITGWANYLAPLFHCTRGLHSQGVPLFSNQTAWTSSYYLGVGIVGLALVAVVSRGNLRSWMLAGLSLFSLLMALGGRAHVYDWVKAILPPLGFLRFPSKFVLLPTFAVPLLAAFGLNSLLTAPPGTSRKRRRLAGLIVATIAVLLVALIWLAMKHPLPQDDVSETVTNTLVRILFLALISACVAMLLRSASRPGLSALGQTCLILLLWCDVLTHAPNLSPTVDSGALAPDTIRTFFNWDRQLQPGVSRALQTQPAYRQMVMAGFENTQLDVTGRRLVLFLNYNLLDHAAKTDGFYPLEVRDSTRLCKDLSAATNHPDGLLDFLGVSLISDRTNLVGWDTRDSFLPLITGGQQPVFADPGQTTNALLSPGFNPRHEVFLPPEAQSAIHATGNTAVEINSFAFSNQHITFLATAAAPAMVVVAQTYYHPWRAYVDGQPVTIWKANYAFQALEVPAGNHQVSLVYDDRQFKLGCALSVLSLLACAAIWFWNRKSPAPVQS